MKLLLFDVDQTLVSTGGAGLRALNRAFKHVLGVDNAMDGILPHGKTDPGIIREIGLARNITVGGALDSILDNYLTSLREEVETSTSYRVLPGIVRLLDELSERSGVVLGLATGNIELGARIKLERGNLNRYFGFGGYGSDCEDRAALVRRAAQRAACQFGCEFPPEDVFVIGDTPRDIDAARAAGFQAIGVATGQYSVDTLARCHPEVLLTIPDLDQGRTEFLSLL